MFTSDKCKAKKKQKPIVTWKPPETGDDDMRYAWSESFLYLLFNRICEKWLLFFYMCQNVKQTKYAATSVKFPASYFVSDEKLREQRRRQISLGVTL